MDSAGPILVTAHALHARSGGSTGNEEERPSFYKAVGISLAIASGVFIGVSFVLKKMGLLKANVKYNEEAGEGYGYLRNVWWWSGMTLMIIGEICNFVAYAFVDAILVTPLGALSVVVTTILSAIFLKERLSFVGKVGCFNCIIGSIVIVVNAPEQSAVKDIQDMQDLVITPGFLSYTGVILVGCAVVAFYVGPRWGKKSMMVYLTICSLIGGLSVVCTQGLGASIIAQIDGKDQFTEWFIYVLLVFVIATLLTEIIYLNKALNIFNAALVTPTYYVFFTSSTIVTSAILFQGFNGSASTIATVVLGFFQICAGVVLLQLSKSAKDVPDTAVFTGDLDQVRTVAEQEEPEYEPRADTIRGSGALLRSLSKARDRRQTMEVQKLKEEHMESIGENETVEWDGLRRRKTVVGDQLGPDGTRIPLSPLRRRSSKSHPPLGMSYFPEPDSDHASEEEEEEEAHPGFFTRMRSRGKGAWLPSPMRRQHDRETAHAQLAGERPPVPPHAPRSAPATQQEHDLSKEADGAGGSSPVAIHWADQTGDHLTADHPRTRPPHSAARRQFSFQNMFRRKSSDGSGESPHGTARSVHQRPPVSRGGLSFTRSHSSIVGGPANSAHGSAGTEEERMGLVKGDSVSEGAGGSGLAPVSSGTTTGSAEASASSPLAPQQGVRVVTEAPPAYTDEEGYLVPRLPPLSGLEMTERRKTQGEKAVDDRREEDELDEKGKGWRRGRDAQR